MARTRDLETSGDPREASAATFVPGLFFSGLFDDAAISPLIAAPAALTGAAERIATRPGGLDPAGPGDAGLFWRLSDWRPRPVVIS